MSAPSPGPAGSPFPPVVLAGLAEVTGGADLWWVMFDLSPVAASIVHLDSELLLVNRAYRELMRIGADETVTLDHVRQRAHPDEIDRLRGLLDPLERGEVERVEVDRRYVRADGTAFWGHMVATSLGKVSGEPVAVYAAVEDITERLQAQAARTAFVASVSHELRTPIHGILGLAELLSTSGLDAESIELVRSITRAADALRMVVDDILDFSKIEVGRLDVEMGAVKPLDITDDIVSLFGPQASAKGLRLVVDVDHRLPEHLQGDALRLRQILTNLVGNAVKFTRHGEVVVRVWREDARWLIEVRDTGIGIDDDVVNRLFEPFSQAHTATASQYGGTGLGLAITKRLVDLMGGEIDLRSEKGIGTTCTVALPLLVADSSSQRRRDPGEASLSDRARPLVMVVEDSAINQLVARGQLERLGYEALVCSTGLEALSMLEKLWSGDDDQVSAVLMDWQMPGLDGLETTRRLRVAERARGRERTPVIAMTASAMVGDRDRCLAAGMDDFVTKPARLDVIGEVLARWTGRPPAE